jgi:hypothetical protein
VSKSRDQYQKNERKRVKLIRKGNQRDGGERPKTFKDQKPVKINSQKVEGQ